MPATVAKQHSDQRRPGDLRIARTTLCGAIILPRGTHSAFRGGRRVHLPRFFRDKTPATDGIPPVVQFLPPGAPKHERKGPRDPRQGFHHLLGGV